MEIRLRPLAESDLPLLERWLHAPHVARWYENPQDWLTEVRGRNGAFRFLRHFIVLADNTPVGFAQYYPYEASGETWQGSLPVRGTYSIDYLIGEPDFLGRGCGRETVRRLVERIAAEPDARRVIVYPEEENAASRRTLRSAGFGFDADNGVFLLELATPGP